MDTHLLILRQLITATIILAAFILTGCASTVALEQTAIPRPHIERLPLDVAVRIPENFHNFVHEENVLGRENWKIELGAANVKFFDQLFGYMFDSVTLIGPDDSAANYTFDALIEPTIEGFEFSVPNQSKDNSFAVWVRYRIQVYDRQGTDAGVWTVSAYGKSQKEGLGGSNSLRRAAVLAMRDAAALVLLQFDNATRISALADGPFDPSAERGETVAKAEPASERPPQLFAIGGIDDDGD